jgi:hypothetical protein
LTSSFPILILFISCFCLIALAWNSKTILIGVEKADSPVSFLTLRETVPVVLHLVWHWL